MNDERSANLIDRRLGQRLRARRLEAGLSQERLAELLGLTFQQVQKYEKGVNRIAASRLFDIAVARATRCALTTSLVGGRKLTVLDNSRDLYDLASADYQRRLRACLPRQHPAIPPHCSAHVARGNHGAGSLRLPLSRN